VDRAEAVRTTGLSPRSGALLAYLGWWVTGALMLVMEKRDPFIRFHAGQALVALGGIWITGLVAYAGAFVLLSVSAIAFRAMLWFSLGVWAAGLGLWIVGMVSALRGERWRIPLAAQLADRFTRSCPPARS
jgi:uncharacterized membrane protein